MKNYKITIQYDGSRYKGWQRLKDNDNTIQAKLENVLSKMTSEKIEVFGSGRTDAGVHAENQIANFKTNFEGNTQEIMEYLYRYLPDDIVVKKVEVVDERFHARYNAKGKKYVYTINNSRVHNVFDRKYTYHVDKKLNIEEMQKAANVLIGEHDFKSFTTMKSKEKSTVRNIYSIKIDKKEEYVYISVCGSGFLRNMVRIISGTLIEVGIGNLKTEDVIDILYRKDRSVSGPTAPPEGLSLMEVQY